MDTRAELPEAFSSMSGRAALTVFACLLAVCAAGCGSSGTGLDRDLEAGEPRARR